MQRLLAGPATALTRDNGLNDHLVGPLLEEAVVVVLPDPPEVRFLPAGRQGAMVSRIRSAPTFRLKETPEEVRRPRDTASRVKEAPLADLGAQLQGFAAAAGPWPRAAPLRGEGEGAEDAEPREM